MSATPLVGITAHSGTGKTTLICNLLQQLAQRKLRIGVIKHAHHAFEIDQPGKDSYRMRQAGAAELLIGSATRWALMGDAPGDRPFSLDDHIRRIDGDGLDLILVEGFKLGAIPKVELIRPSLGGTPFFPDDEHIIAVATDDAAALETDLPVLDLNEPEAIAAYLCQRFLASR